MPSDRRFFLRAIVPATVLGAARLAATPSLAFGQQSTSATGRPLPPPQMTPPRMQPSPFPKPTMAQLRKNQREITKDVDQLFLLAQQLKRQSEKSDASEELSVGLIEKTKQIEKLAKKIRDLATS